MKQDEAMRCQEQQQALGAAGQKLLMTVCRGMADNEQPPSDAQPLYNAIDGEIELYAVATEYEDREYHRLIKEIEAYDIKRTLFYDTAAFRSFVAGMSYDEGTRTEATPMTPLEAVIMDGQLAGARVCGKWYIWEGYQSDSLDTANTYQRNIFLPLGEKPRKTDYYSSTTIYGSDGEEDETIHRTFTAIEKRIATER